MPHLRRQPFHRQKPPPDLRPDDYVFHCKLTNEIFRDYEEFFERIILCNSLVWSCSITGRAGLTYQEAQECEEKALKNLATFPSYLQKPVLYLASITHRSRLVDMNDDIFMFIKDRFFIGEVVEVMLGGERKSCKVIRVVPPSMGSDAGCIVIDDDDEEETSKPKGATLPADQYRYVVQEKGKSNITITVPAKHVSRKKGVFTRDKCKLFLKQHSEPTLGIWKLKNETITKKGLNGVNFHDFFAGPVPAFGFSESKRKSMEKKDERHEVAPGPSDHCDYQKKKKKPKGDKDSKKKDGGKKEEEEISSKEEIIIEPAKLTPEERKALQEKFKQQKLAEKMAKKEELRLKMQEEREKKKEEKAKEREKKLEEKRIQADFLREWSKPRDDLECDDLKVMPEPAPVRLRIPTEVFGDAVMIVEFINCFKALFDLKEYFPKGFNIGVLEKALIETDHNGILTDILLMMMTAIFTLQEEEEEEEQQLSKKGKKALGNIDDIDIKDNDQLIQAASSCAKIPQIAHGCILKKLPLDSFTLSEILRLHLMSSGAAATDKNAKYRFQMRGGYTSLDDPGLEFRRQEPALLRKLSMENLFDLPPSDKIKLLKVLTHQFLTYAATRDTVEDNYEKLRQVRLELKQFQWSEQRREREEAAARYKRRMEERMKERERLEKKRLKKIKEMETKLKKDEAKNGNQEDQQMEQNEEENDDDDDDDEPPMTEEEKEELRQQEEEEEADKKANFALKEKKYLQELAQLQHGNAIYPLGRDRMYRRYWLFQSLPGLYVEDYEEHVNEEDLMPVPQNPKSNPFIQGSQLPVNVPKKRNEENTSDKENESFNNSTANNSLNVSNMNTSHNDQSDVTSQSNIVNGVLVNGNDTENKDVVEISDDEKSKDSDKPDEDMQVDDKQPPELESLAVKQIVERPKCQWAYFTSTEQVDELIQSLNSRGYREGALKLALLEQKNRIVELVDKCPVDQLATGKTRKEEIVDEEMPEQETEGADKGSKTNEAGKKVKWTKKGIIKENSAQEVLELNLRELLLDLEERIYAGSLGALKVKDRLAWRDAIEKGNYDPQTEDPTFCKHDSVVKENEEARDEDASVSSDDSAESTIKDLSKSLLQIERSIEAKYLVHPLGEGEDKKKTAAEIKKEREELWRKKEKERKEREEKEKENEKNGDDNDESDEEDIVKHEEPKVQERTTLQRWEDSLLYCTSLSQIFLHLGTLEKSIAWSKSALHTRCRICRKKGDADKMLLCDMCDRGHHLYCLKPALKTVPQGDWFCPDCRPKEIKRSPRKGRRQTFTEMSEEDEAEEDEEEEEEVSDSDVSETSDEEEEDSEADNDNLCAVCCKAGMLICCDTCPLAYHLGCADPPMKKVPRGRWLCQLCSGVGKTGKIKLPKGGKGKGMKVTPVSSRASSRQESPRDSPVTVNSRKSKKRASCPPDEDLPKKMRKNSRSMSKLVQDLNGVDDGPKHYVSSSRGNTKVQNLKSLEEIVNELMKIDECLPFLKPVSKKLVPDYFDIITTPMDFGTIRNKINRFMYKEPSELISDVRQIFTNCFEYNKRTTQEFKSGLSLSKLFEKRMKEMNISLDDESEGASSSKRSRRTL